MKLSHPISTFVSVRKDPPHERKGLLEKTVVTVFFIHSASGSGNPDRQWQFGKLATDIIVNIWSGVISRHAPVLSTILIPTWSAFSLNKGATESCKHRQSLTRIFRQSLPGYREFLICCKGYSRSEKMFNSGSNYNSQQQVNTLSTRRMLS